MARIEISSTTLKVLLRGVDKLLALHGNLEVPLSQVREATTDPEAARGSTGFRFGTSVPGLVAAGSFFGKGEWSFYDVHNRKKIVVITLDGYKRYKRIVIDVADPSGTARAINDAVAGSAG